MTVRLNLTSFPSARRGAVFLESILVLPVLLILLSGVLFVARTAFAQLELRAQVRACAWQLSLSGCKELPASCASSLFKRDSAHPELSSSSLLQASQPSSTSSFLSSQFQRVWQELFSHKVTSQAKQSIHRPKLLGGQTITVESYLTLPCSRSLSEEAKHVDDLFSSLTSN